MNTMVYIGTRFRYGSQKALIVENSFAHPRADDPRQAPYTPCWCQIERPSSQIWHYLVDAHWYLHKNANGAAKQPPTTPAPTTPQAPHAIKHNPRALATCPHHSVSFRRLHWTEWRSTAHGDPPRNDIPAFLAGSTHDWHPPGVFRWMPPLAWRCRNHYERQQQEDNYNCYKTPTCIAPNTKEHRLLGGKPQRKKKIKKFASLHHLPAALSHALNDTQSLFKCC